MPRKNKQERREYNVRYYANNKEKLLKAARDWRVGNQERLREYESNRPDRTAEREYLRLLALQAAGGECAHCRIRDPRVLRFDHVIPLMGAQKRQPAQTFYRSIIVNGMRGLQVLCANCHEIKIHEEGSRRMAFDSHYCAAMQELSSGVYQ